MLYRLSLLVDDRRMASKLADQLRSEDNYVTIIKRKKNILNYIARQNSDMFVISLSLLPEPTADSLEILKSLPENPAIVLITESENPEAKVNYMAMGCDAVLYSQLKEDKIADAVKSIVESRLELQTQLLSKPISPIGPKISDFVSSSLAMRSFMKIVQKIVKTDTSLLITGETGVGKERLARAIHEEGLRSEEPFIPVNCAALPDNLLESEIFGHEQGAFTGATRSRRGAFELAHKGTIFLDEIGDMPLNLQVKILRVIQEKEFTRVGGEKNIKVDVRIMAATNKELQHAVADKEFRQDLYYRLSVVSLKIPPLRERREDIAELVQSYIEYLNTKIGTHVKKISKEALQSLEEYDWPGNVRELINVVERALLLSNGNTITVNDLPEEISASENLINVSIRAGQKNILFKDLPEDLVIQPWKKVRKEMVDALEKEYLIQLLKKTGGRIGETAKIAGMDSRSLYDKMQYHDLKKENFRFSYTT